MFFALFVLIMHYKHSLKSQIREFATVTVITWCFIINMKNKTQIKPVIYDKALNQSQHLKDT